MKDYEKVRGTEKPDSKVVDDYSVWINKNIQFIKEEVGEETFEGYEWEQVQYSKDEYIKMLDDRNDELESSIIDTQAALCDIYEMIGDN